MDPNANLAEQRRIVARVKPCRSKGFRMFKHDCKKCVSLGSTPTKTRERVDLYWCISPSMSSLASVIGRYGNEGYEYAASHPPEAFADPKEYIGRNEIWYRVAMSRAIEKGLYKGNYVRELENFEKNK